MEITQLEFFLKVVEEGSFSRAAERAFRTQPAVSLAIRRLEDEIGAPLFDRAQKTPTLTEVGEVFHDYARRIITLRDEARGVVAELRELRAGRVRVGANESTSLYLLPDVILDFRARHPGVKVESTATRPSSSRARCSTATWTSRSRPTSRPTATSKPSPC